MGSFGFSDVELKYFSYKIPGSEEVNSHNLNNQTMSHADTSRSTFQIVDFQFLGVADIFGAMGLGFSLSLLFFMDQNIRYGINRLSG